MHGLPRCGFRSRRGGEHRRCSPLRSILPMDEPRKHPKMSRADLDYIIAGGTLVDIDSIKERKAGARHRPAVFPGDRTAIRAATVDHAFKMIRVAL
jgi:hypothetical protein